MKRLVKCLSVMYNIMLFGPFVKIGPNEWIYLTDAISDQKKEGCIVNTIGDRIKDLREERSTSRRMTQADLAKAMGVQEKQISKWENNEVKLNADRIVKLADFFGVSVDYLVRGGKIDNLVMMNETGLSDQTIDRMKANKAKGKTEIVEMVNILSDTSFTPHPLLPTSGELILSAMYDFIHCEDMRVMDSPENGGHYIGGLPDIYMVRIIKELQFLRESYQRTKEPENGAEIQENEVLILEKTSIF